MINPRSLDEITHRILDALPEGMDRLHEDAQRNVKAAVSAALSRMDVVSREEFDVQSAVLARTREKLEALEKRVRELESPADAPPGTPDESPS